PTGTGQVVITNAETFQEDYWISVGGGGASNCYTIDADGYCTGGFAQPAWQQNLSIAGQTTSVLTTTGVAPVRFSPDVSLLASPDFPGYILCTNGSCEGTGGIAGGNFDII